MDIKSELKARAGEIEKALAGYLSETDEDFGIIYDAMRYSLMAGGKRLRPFLAVEFAILSARENGTDEKEALDNVLPYACAIEMIHTYSLIHDDLPCMDNDDLRRGKPTNHIKFGYANALLAGDGLLTKAFETASSGKDGKMNSEAVSLLAKCAGAAGMIGGQVLDLIGEEKSLDLPTLEKLQTLKTGELIRCACLLGCIAGGASDKLKQAATVYAMGVGRAFQVIDDILDVTADEATLGKPIGSDAASGKTTFLTFMTVEEAKAYAVELTNKACDAIKTFEGSDVLCELAEYLTVRNM